MPDGSIGHAEVELQGSVVMLATQTDGVPELGVVRLRSPRNLPGHRSHLRVYIDDVDAHYARAEAAGARITGLHDEPYGERTYRAADPEDHRWIFAQAA